MPSLPYISLPSMPSAPALWGKMRTLCPELRTRLSSVGKRPRMPSTVSTVSTASATTTPPSHRGRHSTGRQTNHIVLCSPGSMVLEGSTDLADYELLSVLGRGTFGVVRLARHRATGRAVAIKIVTKDNVHAMKQHVNILREQSVHLKLHHPFISRIYSTFQDHEAVYFVLEYCPGGEVYSLVYPQEEDEDGEAVEDDGVHVHVHVHVHAVDDETCATDSESSSSSSSSEDEDIPPTPARRRSFQRKRSQSATNACLQQALTNSSFGGLREPHVAFYVACLVSALSYLHDDQNVLYRDLKLENLVISTDGYPKLIDFGLAKPDAVFAGKNRGKNTKNTTMCGSMEYMAPEVLQRHAYDHKVDLWSLGVVMYELFFGATPFYHPNAREQSRRIIETEVSFPNQFELEFPQACQLMRLLLAKNPRDRPVDVKEVRKSDFLKTYFPTRKSWHQLEKRQLRAPFVPSLTGPFDTSLFANAYEEEDEEDESFPGY